MRNLRLKESKFLKTTQLVNSRPREPDCQEKNLPAKLMKHFTLRSARTTSSSVPIFFQEPLFAFLWINLICFYSTHMVAWHIYIYIYPFIPVRCYFSIILGFKCWYPYSAFAFVGCQSKVL